MKSVDPYTMSTEARTAEQKEIGAYHVARLGATVSIYRRGGQRARFLAGKVYDTQQEAAERLATLGAGSDLVVAALVHEWKHGEAPIGEAEPGEELKRALCSAGYARGNDAIMGGETWARFYAAAPGVPETSAGDVFIVDGAIVVADPFRERIMARFSSLDAFLDYCDTAASAGSPAWSQGMYDG